MELVEIKQIAGRIQRELSNDTYTRSSMFLVDVEELTRRIINDKDDSYKNKTG